MTRVGHAAVKKRPSFHTSLCNRHVNLTGSRCGFCSPNEARANLDCDLERCSVLVQRPDFSGSLTVLCIPGLSTYT